MLVGQSTAEYVFVKLIIYVFSYLGLICLAYFFLAASIGGETWIAHPFSIAVETIGAIEILFYLFWFLPYRYYLHKQPPKFPAPLNRDGRRELFSKSLGVTPDIELFFRGWMGGASLDDMRRENLKEWMLWSLFDREGPPGVDEEELEEYVRVVEERLGRKIRPGWGPVESLRLNLQRFAVSHRSLVFYLMIGTIDLFSSLTLLVMGFTLYRQPRSQFFRSFPFRPLTLLAPKESAAQNLSYFYRPHTSKTHRPIVFAHGVGIGLAIYIPLFLLLPKDIGILALEVLPVSSRITAGAPLAEDLMNDAGAIIAQQDLTNFVFVGNSYGTFLAKLFLDSPLLSSRMAKMVLIDPVAVLLHLPDLAYNFARKKPVEPNEWQMWWGAETEPDIAFTFARRLCWRSHVLWREDLGKCATTLVLGGSDCLVNAAAIATYVTRGKEEEEAGGELCWSWGDLERWKGSFEGWVGKGLELVWFEGFDHGQAILGNKKLKDIVSIVERYCRKEGGKRVESGISEEGMAEPEPQLGESEAVKKEELN
ncbi:unnamed protein product [Periconia digitata]|uniref:Uncharacterized protein n=1 Tax=Periconia digitata TaxID=1303443 RepID=A0A9W4UKW0_9PLEO|nr:unnamed protein product [Periconia digitata]